MRRNRGDDWDPMSEAYFDGRFNSYHEGPGADLGPALQPYARRSLNQKPLCKIYVHRVPHYVREDALKHIFSRFGNVISFYMKEATGNFTWALVEYENLSEGREAISCLNGQQPLNLAVQFAKSDEEKLGRKKEQEEESLISNITGPIGVPYSVPVLESPYPRPRGRGRGVPFHPRPSVEDVYSHRGHTPREMLSYDLEEEEEGDYVTQNSFIPGMFNPYRGGAYDMYNAFLMNGVSVKGRCRNISLGRGVMAPRREAVARHARRSVYDLEYEEDEAANYSIGKCCYCNDPSTFTCGVCSAWYCSPECQKKDWPYHRGICDCL